MPKVAAVPAKNPWGGGEAKNGRTKDGGQSEPQ